jgi:NAD(P)-dependent dehydrogenase (short-subunit alcohol dehydrogenase family)
MNLLITGASTGIGFDAARYAIARGARVFGSLRSEASAAQTTAALGDRFVPLRFDVTDDAAVSAAAQRVREMLNGEQLHGLVNNAGIAIAGPALYQPLAEWRRVIETNLIGVLSVTQSFAPMLKAQSGARPGRIVNISSVSGKTGWPMLSAYAASKHGLEGLSESLRRELLIYGIDVIVIGPGAVKTPIWEKALRQDVSPYQNSDYAGAFARYNDFVRDSEAAGIAVEHVSALIWHALTTRLPRVRYAPSPNPFVNAVIPLLPKRLVDRIAARMLGLKKR